MIRSFSLRRRCAAASTAGSTAAAAADAADAGPDPRFWVDFRVRPVVERPDVDERAEEDFLAALPLREELDARLLAPVREPEPELDRDPPLRLAWAIRISFHRGSGASRDPTCCPRARGPVSRAGGRHGG